MKRRRRLAGLAGGVVALFPSGGVAASETWFGPAVEGEWNVFTAKMIRRSGAQVLPIFEAKCKTRYSTMLVAWIMR